VSEQPSPRLQKVLAQAGVASRRACEQLIANGRVEVDGELVTQLGARVDPETAVIRVDGRRIPVAAAKVYLVVNKPRGVVSSMADEEGRPDLRSLVGDRPERLFHVGRLDADSEGLLLLTNDGELANQMMKAASHVPKTYMVKVAGTPSSEGLGKLRTGLTIRSDKGKRVRTAPAKINTIREGNNPWYEVTLIEGKNRQIRRMFEEIGHHVEKIKRVRYGPLELDVPPGKFRRLAPQEVAKLRAAAK